jgi:hypothetical protein
MIPVTSSNRARSGGPQDSGWIVGSSFGISGRMAELSRTHHADQAVHLADLVSLKFANTRYGTSRRRIVRVMEPDGPSTDGGRTDAVIGGARPPAARTGTLPVRQARQSIVLMPEDAELGGGGIVCGWLDTFRRVAELKSYAVVSHAFLDRYGMPIDLPKGEYHRMVEAMLEFLRGLQIDARMMHAARAKSVIVERPVAVADPAPVRLPDSAERLTLIAGGALFGFSLCYALFALGVL